MQYLFAADRTLGKLAKWLRILGFDTLFESDYSSEWFYEHLEQNRVLLTRTGQICKQFASHRLVYVESNALTEQLVQVIDDLNITLNDIRPFSRCLNCNTAIVGISKENVFGRVPDYIWQTHDVFSICRHCDRIFWAGSHTERSMEFVEGLFKTNDEN